MKPPPKRSTGKLHIRHTDQDYGDEVPDDTEDEFLALSLMWRRSESLSLANQDFKRLQLKFLCRSKMFSFRRK